MISNMQVSAVLGIPCSHHRNYNIELYKLVEAKFLTAHALPADGSRISSGLARHFSLIPKLMKVGRGNLKCALVAPWDRVGS